MNPFLREKRDGRRAPGYLAYALAGAAVVVAVAVLHSRFGQSRLSRAPVDRGARISPITRAASSMSPMKSEKKTVTPEERSFRLRSSGSTDARSPVGGTPPSRDSFDAIGAALANAPPEDGIHAAGPSRTPLDSGGEDANRGSKFAALPPAFAADTARTGASASASGEHPDLLGYRDPAADMLSDGQAGLEPEAGPRAANFVVPKGTLVRTCLLTSVDTGNPSAVIQFGVTSDLVFNRRRQLDFGVRLLGRLSGRPMHGRLNLVADTVLYPDGLEVPASASAVEADEIGCNIRPGVRASYVPPPPWVQATPYVADLFTGLMGILGSRATTQLTVGDNSLGVQTSVPDRFRGSLYQASAQAVDDFAQTRLREVEERYAAYYVIPAGTACCLQLEADLDLAPAHRPPPARRSIENPIIR